MANRANPAFGVGAVVVPLGLLVATALFGTAQQLTYVHVMAGILWTGIDLFMAMVLGPVLGGLDVEQRAAVFQRFTPKMTFLMPTLAFTTIIGGMVLASRMGYLPGLAAWGGLFAVVAMGAALVAIASQFDAFTDRRWLALFGVIVGGGAASLFANLGSLAMPGPAILAALGIVSILTFLGFGVLLPGEARMYLEMTSANPDTDLIGRIGMRNAKLSGVEGVFQLSIIAVMVYLRWGIGL
ncbi:hypothetical protein [Halobellus clavatus]|jgi:hypothetical protein|uniref:Uncharacterized protein n=1 Tax=Halobellus clavatus TaxID=660517 RepID=A0A1H3F5C3_9EURY|nr:hypothetical protein SAMN04487946_103164 [Halobellus clavatus]